DCARLAARDPERIGGHPADRLRPHRPLAGGDLRADHLHVRVTPEILTVGRVSVDLYPEQVGVPLAEVRTVRKMLGGSPTNVAVAAARLGRRSAVVTRVGDDPFGAYVRRALAEFGVDPARVGTHPTLRTPLAFCELFPPDRFPLLFYREPKAPDLELELDP